MGNIPFAPTQHYDYQRRGQSIRDLMLMSGQQRADAAMRSGQIWGGFAQDLGQIGAGVAQQWGAQKEQEKQQQQIAKRDAATLDLMSKYDGSDDEGLLSGMSTIWGPEEGLKMAEGIKAYKAKPSQKPEDEFRNFAISAKALQSMTPEAQAAAWPKFKERFGPLMDKSGVVPFDRQPDEYSEQAAQSVGALSDSVSQVYGFKGVETPKLTQVTTVGPDGKPMIKGFTQAELAAGVQGYEKEAAPKAPNFDYRDMGDSVGVYQDGQLLRKDPKGVAPGSKGEASAEIEGYLSGLESGDISMSDVSMKDRNRVLEAAAGRGIDTRTKAQKAIDADAEAVLSSLTQLEEQAKKTITATSGPGAMAQGAIQRMGNAVGLSEQTRLWDSQMAKLAGLARQLGERGTLTDKDISRVEALIPGLTDPVTVRDKKLRDVRDIIESGLRQKVSGRVKFQSGGSVDPKAAAERFRQKYGTK